MTTLESVIELVGLARMVATNTTKVAKSYDCTAKPKDRKAEQTLVNLQTSHPGSPAHMPIEVVLIKRQSCNVGGPFLILPPRE